MEVREKIRKALRAKTYSFRLLNGDKETELTRDELRDILARFPEEGDAVTALKLENDRLKEKLHAIRSIAQYR